METVWIVIKKASWGTSIEGVFKTKMVAYQFAKNRNWIDDDVDIDDLQYYIDIEEVEVNE